MLCISHQHYHLNRNIPFIKLTFWSIKNVRLINRMLLLIRNFPTSSSTSTLLIAAASCWNLSSEYVRLNCVLAQCGRWINFSRNSWQWESCTRQPRHLQIMMMAMRMFSLIQMMRGWQIHHPRLKLPTFFLRVCKSCTVMSIFMSSASGICVTGSQYFMLIWNFNCELSDFEKVSHFNSKVTKELVNNHTCA